MIFSGYPALSASRTAQLEHTDDNSKEPQPSEQPPRKPYRTPELEDLGTVAELTQAAAGNPTDGGPMAFQGSVI